jgi:hypothetical protein
VIKYKLPNVLSFLSDDGTPMTILGSNQLITLNTPEWVHITAANSRVNPQTIESDGYKFEIVGIVLGGATSMSVIFSSFPRYSYSSS